MSARCRLCLSFLILSGLMYGCTGTNKNAPCNLSGKVSYKGSPVSGGDVALHPKGAGQIYSAGLGADGSYNITDVPAGDYTVTINTERLNPSNKTPEYTGGGKGGGDKMKGGGGGGGAGNAPKGGMKMSPMPKEFQEKAASAETKYVKIPPDYGDPKKSTLSVTVSSGNNSKNFDLD